MDDDTPAPTEIEAAIVELHRVIEAWFTGALPRTPQAFAAFAEALEPDFTIVSPTGVQRDRATIVSGFEAAHGTDPGLVIEIRGYAFVAADGELGVARYEEWKRSPARSDSRRSMAVLRRRGSRWRWLSLHETWLSGE